MNRHRERGGFIPSNFCYETSNYGTSIGPLAGTNAGTRIVMDDVVIPSFHKKSRDGQIFFNDMSKVETTWGVGTGYGYSWTYGDGSRVYSINDPMIGKALVNGNLVTSENVPGFSLALSESDISSALTEACTKALSKRGSTGVNMSENLAEAHQTIGLVQKPVGSFWRWYRNRAIGSLTLSAANAWLVWRYGVRPLIQDISQVIDNLQKLKTTPRVTSRGNVSLDASSHWSRVVNSGVHYWTLECQVLDTVKIRAMSLDEYTMDWARSLGFDSKAILTLPWELLNKSFVVDWFVNVGDFLQALAPAVGVKQLGSCCTVDRITTNVWSFGSCWVSSGTLLRAPVGTLFGSDRHKTRRPLSAPGIALKSDFRFDNAERIGDALSLILQKVSPHLTLLGVKR